MSLMTDHHIPSPQKPAQLDRLLASTPARLGVWRAGTRPRTDVWLRFRQDHALARDAVIGNFSESFLDRMRDEKKLPIVHTFATNRSEFVLFPPRGKRAPDEDIVALTAALPQDRDVQ